MRHLLPLFIALSLATPALAANPPAVDLVGKFLLGADDGATLALGGGQIVAKLKKAGPGTFDGQPAKGDPFEIRIVEPSDCVFDVTFMVGGNSVSGIELDAHKLKAVTYQPADKQPQWQAYKLYLGGEVGVLQRLSPQGILTPIDLSSLVRTSLGLDAMQAAVKTFRSAYCPGIS